MVALQLRPRAPEVNVKSNGVKGEVPMLASATEHLKNVAISLVMGILVVHTVMMTSLTLAIR